MYFNSQGTRQDFNTTSNSSLIHLVLVAGFGFGDVEGNLVFNADNFNLMKKMDNVMLYRVAFCRDRFCVKSKVKLKGGEHRGESKDIFHQ